MKRRRLAGPHSFLAVLYFNNMADSKTFSNFKDAIFTMAVIGGIVGGIKMYSDIGKLENTDKRFQESSEKRSKQWGQIGALRKHVHRLEVDAAYEKGYRIAREKYRKSLK